MDMFSTPLFWIIIGIAVGGTVLSIIIRAAMKKSGRNPDEWKKQRSINRDAQHVRDVVAKYDKEHNQK